MDRPSMDVFSQAFTVSVADIDDLGHVNNTVYLRWVQSIATAHWRSAAAPEDQAALVWMVLRHEIDYKHPAVLGDEILARTWVGVAGGLRFERHTEILRHSDLKPLAQARTLWCPIDPRTGKPCRVSPAVRARFSVEPPENHS